MNPCIVVCHFALPIPAEDAFIKIAQRSAPKFRALEGQGLLSKDYVRAADGVGGVYVWESRAAAEAWFTEENLAEYTTTFGARPTLTWYESSLTVDNKAEEVRVHGEPAAQLVG